MKAFRLFSLALVSVASVLAAAGCSTESTSDAESTEDAVTAFPALPAGYEQMSAAAKRDLLWDQRIVTSKYASLPAWPKVDLPGIMRLDLSVTLNRRSDELPVGRKKLVHALGTCAKVELVADENQPYSGMFKGGDAIARFSLAAPPGEDNYTPAVALKFFINGQPSTNLQVMYSIDGQGKNFDFFANRFSNVLAEPTGFGTNIIGFVFKKASPFPNNLDLDGFARYDQAGTLYTTTKFKAPAQIHFIPTAEVAKVIRVNSPASDFRREIARVPVGTTMWDVVAADSASAPFVRVGKIVLRSEVVASAYGDEKLFFKHEEATKAP